MKLNVAALIAMLALVAAPADAQRAFEDAAGDGSIFIAGGGFARANISDAAIRIGYLYDQSDRPFRFGVEISGKLAGKRANIFSIDQFAPEAQVAFTAGKKWLFSSRPQGEPATSPLTDDWLTLEAAYRRATFDVLPSAASGVAPVTFDGWRVRAAYNALLATPRGPIVAGVSLGAERTNNIDALQSVTVETILEEDASRRVSSQRKAFFGDFQAGVQVPVHVDVVWFPAYLGGRIGVDVFLRSRFADEANSVVPGVGVFLSQEGAPTRVIAGFSISRRQGETRIGLIAGFNF